MRSVVLLVVLALSSVGANWKADLTALLKTEPGEKREKLLEKVLSAGPGWQEVASEISVLSYPHVREKGKPVLRKTVCTDGVERPYVLVVPSSYNPATPTPLLVVLHGGVSRTTIRNTLEYVRESEFTPLAEAQGWLVLFPFGQKDATWWDEVGMANVRNLVRTTKREFNVDDDRVWMGGFSDGGSASFLFAMVDPNDYGAFIALNGHMGVGSLDGNLATYAPNLHNTPVYAVTTDKDSLYPTHRMSKTLDMAMKAGGDVYYRALEGAHDFNYAADELPRIARFLHRHPRNPLPVRIVWETAESRFGQCRWFVIDKVRAEDPAPWHHDHNTALVDDRITFGFMVDSAFEGQGVKIDRVLDDYPASEMGLQAGDIIVRIGGHAIRKSADSWEAKKHFKRGDAVEIEVLRGKETRVLKGRIPPPENHFVFKRDKPSALARVTFQANHVDIEASRLGAFRILVHPDLVRLDQDLTARVNGTVVHDSRVEPDLAYMLRNFLNNRDRMAMYVAEVSIELP